jgi:hypothetical protein
VKKLEQILPKLNAQDKAWVRIWPKKFHYSVEQIRQKLRKKTGEDIDPTSIQQYLNAEFR